MKGVERPVIVFDTSFLIDMLRFRVDLGLLLEELGDYEKVVLDSTLFELKKLAQKASKKGMYARLALSWINSQGFNIVKTGERDFDKAILKMKGNFYVATTDLKLRKKLKEKGVKTIYLRAKKKIDIG